MWASIINTILGLWVMISPYVLHFEKTAANNNYIVGPLVITFAITSLWEVNRSARYLNMVAGSWLVISPFLLRFKSADVIWITVVSGILILSFSFVKGKVRGNYGGGWRSLFVETNIKGSKT